MLEEETLEFEGQFCLGDENAFAFIGFSPDGADSFEIQASQDVAQQEIQLIVSQVSYLGGEITSIELGDLEASGSATFPLTE